MIDFESDIFKFDNFENCVEINIKNNNCSEKFYARILNSIFYIISY
jgi:hypothetical protein